MIHKLPLGGGWTDERDMPAPAGRTFRELYARASAPPPNASRREPRDECPASRRRTTVPRAVAPRRIARHRERVRRARRSQRACAAGQGHRLVLHRPAGFPDARATSRTRRSRRSAAASTATRRRPASTSCARPRRATSARGAASTSAPDDVVVGAGAKPFIAYTIASVTDYGAGDEVIYPVPGFPIYESQIVANGAVPVPIFLREARDFAFDPRGARGEDHAEDAAADPQLAAEPDRRHAVGAAISTRSPRSCASIRRSGCSPTRSTRGSIYDGEFDSLARRAGMLERTDHLRRRVEDLGDDRLAHRLRRQPRARAGVHALDHQHRIVRIADLAMGRGGGDQRAAGLGRRHARALPRAARPDRPAAERRAGRDVQDARAARSTRGRTSPRRASASAAADSEEFRKRLLHEAGIAVLADIHFGRRVPGDGQHIRFSYAASNAAIENGVARLDAFVRKHTRLAAMAIDDNRRRATPCSRACARRSAATDPTTPRAPMRTRTSPRSARDRGPRCRRSRRSASSQRATDMASTVERVASIAEIPAAVRPLR